MAKKKDIETQMIEFTRYFGSKKMVSFIEHLMPLMQVFHTTDESDWVIDKVGVENERNVRLLVVAYIVSKMAESHSGTFVYINSNFKGLWKDLEVEAEREISSL